jgi:hypothetical protein
MTYMSDHLVKLSKFPFKFEMSRKSGKGVMYSNVHNNFLKIKLLLLSHETLCYLIDSLNLILVHFLYFHDDLIMTYHDHNKNQSSMGIKKNVM